MKPKQWCAPALALALLAATMPSAALASSPGAGLGSGEPTDSRPDGPAPTDSAGGKAPTDPAGGKAKDAPQVQKYAGTTMKTYAAKPEHTKTITLDDSEVTIIGAKWTGEDPELEMRYRDGSGWSAWSSLPADAEDGPDADSAEAKQIPAEAKEGQSEAVPVLDSTSVEVRSAAGDGDTDDLSITTVATDVTKADAAAAKKGSALARQDASTQISHHELKANIVTRKEWGADEKLVRCKTDKTSSAKGVFVHHSAGSNSYTKSQAPGIIRGYLAYHTKERGWCDLGYNFLVDKYGTMYEGRAGSIDLAVTGAHASGFNSYTFGISVMGSYGSSAPSTAAQNSVKRLVVWKANQYAFNPTGKMTLTSGGGGTSKYPKGKKVSLNVVSGHRDTSYTECPGTAFYGKLGSIRSGAKSMQSKVGGYPSKGAIGTYYRANSTKTGEARGTEKSLTNPKGAYQHYAKGTVYWSSPTGAHLNAGGIRNGYQRAKYEKGVLGFPSSEEKTFKYRKSAKYQNFESGMIAWSSATKGQPMSHGMLSRWKSLGWERSSLGLPTSGEFSSAGKTRQNFEHGYMTYKKGEGVKVYAG